MIARYKDVAEGEWRDLNVTVSDNTTDEWVVTVTSDSELGARLTSVGIGRTYRIHLHSPAPEGTEPVDYWGTIKSWRLNNQSLDVTLAPATTIEEMM